MKIAIMGAGALGGTFGCLLNDAGFDVTLVDVDTAKIQAIKDQGLTVIMPDGERRTHAIAATTEPGEVGVVDLVQISVKGYHTSSAAALALPMIGPGTRVLSVQNGLKNLRRIAEVVGKEKVIGGVTAHSAMPLAHNVIKYNGGLGGIYIGRYDGAGDPWLLELADLFNAAGFETHLIQGDVRIPIWRKLLANISCNAVAALTGFTGRQLVEFEPTNRLIRALAEETAEVARAQGFEFAELEYAGDFAIKALSGVGDNKISMLQDIEAGRRTEIDTLNLAIVERGEEYGVDTPLNWMIGILIRALEQKQVFDREAARAAAEALVASAKGARGEPGDVPPMYDPAAASVTQAALRNGSRAQGTPESVEKEKRR
ncbi:MAG: 2-dehydropantoate 2-reductase [Thermoleophilia bacterium]|nr:2-dehydropantoate 2-reductase [Thermoleophilia bacterium]